MRKCMQMCMCESVFKWECVSIRRKGVYVRLYWSVGVNMYQCASMKMSVKVC